MWLFYTPLEMTMNGGQSYDTLLTQSEDKRKQLRRANGNMFLYENSNI